MANDNTTGLDMRETIDWYRRTDIFLSSPRNANSFPYPIEERTHIELTDEEIAYAWNLFPEQAQKRSILRKVVGQAAAGFAKDSTSIKPKTSYDFREALTPTAIIPSYIDYTEWRKSVLPVPIFFSIAYLVKQSLKLKSEH